MAPQEVGRSDTNWSSTGSYSGKKRFRWSSKKYPAFCGQKKSLWEKSLIFKDAPQKPHLGKILSGCRTNFPILEKSRPEPIRELQRSDSSNLSCVCCATYAICPHQLGSAKFDLKAVEIEPIFEGVGFHAIDQRWRFPRPYLRSRRLFTMIYVLATHRNRLHTHMRPKTSPFSQFSDWGNLGLYEPYLELHDSDPHNFLTNLCLTCTKCTYQLGCTQFGRETVEYDPIEVDLGFRTPCLEY